MLTESSSSVSIQPLVLSVSLHLTAIKNAGKVVLCYRDREVKRIMLGHKASPTAAFLLLPVEWEIRTS